MGKIITICNFKGGTGKTTTCHTLGVGLGVKGYKVLLIDADQQRNLSIASNINTTGNTNTIYELMKGEREPQDIIYHTEYYDLICGNLSVSRADSEFTRPPYLMNCYYLLKKQIDKIKDNYDFILIDTPPSLTLMTQNAMVASDSLIIPTHADIFCINALGDLKQQIDLIKSNTTNTQLAIEGILLTKYSDRMKLNQILKDELLKMCKYLNTKVYQYAIRTSIGIGESQLIKENILISNPNNIVAFDYNLFINEFIRDNSKKGGK